MKKVQISNLVPRMKKKKDKMIVRKIRILRKLKNPRSNQKGIGGIRIVIVNKPHEVYKSKSNVLTHQLCWKTLFFFNYLFSSEDGWKAETAG